MAWALPGVARSAFPPRTTSPPRPSWVKPVHIDLNGLSFEEAVQRLIRPVEVEEVSESEYRGGRDRRKR